MTPRHNYNPRGELVFRLRGLNVPSPGSCDSDEFIDEALLVGHVLPRLHRPGEVEGARLEGHLHGIVDTVLEQMRQVLSLGELPSAIDLVGAEGDPLSFAAVLASDVTAAASHATAYVHHRPWEIPGLPLVGELEGAIDHVDLCLEVVLECRGGVVAVVQVLAPHVQPDAGGLVVEAGDAALQLRLSPLESRSREQTRHQVDETRQRPEERRSQGSGRGSQPSDSRSAEAERARQCSKETGQPSPEHHPPTSSCLLPNLSTSESPLPRVRGVKAAYF